MPRLNQIPATVFNQQGNDHLNRQLKEMGSKNVIYKTTSLLFKRLRYFSLLNGPNSLRLTSSLHALCLSFEIFTNSAKKYDRAISFAGELKYTNEYFLEEKGYRLIKLSLVCDYDVLSIAQ